jgi:hypothetical protein
MKPRLTRDWWVCLCDRFGNVSHKPVGEWLGLNRRACIEGAAADPLAVALAASLDASQEAGVLVKRQVASKKCGDGKDKERG